MPVTYELRRGSDSEFVDAEVLSQEDDGRIWIKTYWGRIELVEPRLVEPDPEWARLLTPPWPVFPPPVPCAIM